MKSRIISCLVILTLFTVLSCKKEEEKIELPNPPSTIVYQGVSSIDGDLSEYLEVVPGEYKLELKKDDGSYGGGYQGEIKIKFKFLKSNGIKAGTGYNQFGPELIGKVLDEQGVPLSFELTAGPSEELATYIKRGSGEEWLTFTVSAQGIASSTEEGQKMLDMFVSGKKIRFNSKIVAEEFDKDSEGSVSVDNEDSTGNSDCDQMLADYENFMNDYVSILKQYKEDPSDVSVLSDYQRLMTESAEWSTKISDCANDPTFAPKFSAIQVKIANSIN